MPENDTSEAERKCTYVVPYRGGVSRSCGGTPITHELVTDLGKRRWPLCKEHAQSKWHYRGAKIEAVTTREP